MKRLITFAGAWIVLATSVPGEARPRIRRMTSPASFEIPRHRRDGARLRKVLRENFDVLAPHLYEVLRECPRARDLRKLRRGDSPYLVVTRNHPGPHWVRREVRDRLIFAAAFAHAKGGYRLAVGVGRRTLRQQAQLWNWRVVERFAALLRRKPKANRARLARLARPAGEVANPMRMRCSSPHLTGGAVDVMLISPDGEPLVTIQKKFMYWSKKAYLKRFLLSESEEARHARLLEEVMYSAGFVRYCREAWHFETGSSPLHRFWRAAGKPGRCFGAGKGGTWDPRREPDEGGVGDLLAGLPRI